MKIIFLGTGTSQGIPVIGSNHPVCLSNDPKDKRLRVSVSIQWENFKYIIDCGPDFRQQMLQNNIQHIDGVLFTHEHSDHTAGLDDIRPFYFKQGNIDLYAQKRVFNSLYKRFEYIFDPNNDYPGVPNVNVHEINDSFILQNKTVTPIEMMHANLPIIGFRIDDFAYITDASFINKENMDKLKKLKVLVINALRIEKHYSHFSLEEAIEISKTLKPEKTYFTHISHLLGFHQEVENSLPENMHLAYDGLVLKLAT
jgi:phosphoribosyl 1,2-cyclic phosphate phosphodiesterase